jgi:hypothetical protein
VKATSEASRLRPPNPAPSPRRQPRPQEETVVRRAREAIDRIGPELRRLERLRDRLSAHQQAGPGARPSEPESLLNKFLQVLSHGTSALEEGWVELHDCFSERGIVRLERQVARERNTP